MNLNPAELGSTLYDVLDLKPDASQQEVREAYQRTKAAYNKDSLALYTLISQSEREEILRRVEEAYIVLSDVDKRREYDRCHGLLELNPEEKPQGKVVSIDRVPPMDLNATEADLLVAPATDFMADAPASGGFESLGAPAPAPPPAPTPSEAPAPIQAPTAATPAATTAMASESLPMAQADGGLAQEIAGETEWKGAFLRKIREARRVSMEELSHATKISKTYITAIEEEEFKKLPAAVFVRGFLLQLCRILKIPGDSVVPPYMARYNQARARD